MTDGQTSGGPPSARERGAARLLRPYFARNWRSLAVSLLASVGVVLAELAKPLPLAIVVDRLLGDERRPPFGLGADDLRLLVAAVAIVLGVAIAEALGNYLSDITLRRAGERITHDLRQATHGHLQRLSLAYHERRHTGDLVTRLTSDVTAVGQIFSESLGTVAQALLLLVGMVVVSVVIDPLLALAAFAVTPLLAFVTVRARRRLKQAARLQRRQDGQLAAVTNETFSAVREVKASGSEPYEQDRLTRLSEERRQAGLETYRIEGRFSAAIDTLSALGTGLVLVVGVLQVAGGTISVGALVIMYSYVRRVNRPLRDLARQAGRITRAMARAERVGEVLGEEGVLPERPGAHHDGRARGELALERVGFAYDEDRPTLSELSLTVPAGQKLALVGRSGAGKSTVAALLARFHDPVTGHVRLDGRDLREVALRWHREQVGLLLQDSVLFSASVADNVAYGVAAERERVVAAAKAAGAHAFVCNLPEGYDTVLGPDGTRLSGGQRQRIAIARTLLRDPPVLILDEPTTGLDAESEAEVLAGLDVLMRDRTTIIITHSVELARTADRVVVIEQGRVARDGRPEDALLGRPERPKSPKSPKPRPRRTARTGEARAGTPAEADARLGPPVPADPGLPQLGGILDRGTMASVLGRTLVAEGDGDGLEVRVRYLRYKPQTNIVVHYDVGLEGRWHQATAMIAADGVLARRARKPVNLALARRVGGRSPAPSPLAYDDELEALIQWLPLDVSLPSLAERPGALRERLRAAGLDGLGQDTEPATLAYKPRRRAVLRLGDHVLKLYAKDEELRPAVAGLRAASRLREVRTAPLETVVDDLRLTVQTALAGRPLDHLGGAGRAGAVAAELHRSPLDGLPAAPPKRQLEAAAASARLAGTLVEGLGPRLEQLLCTLGEGLPETGELVPSHGDFSPHQLLDLGEQVALIDFDAACMAPPALDLATYASYLVRGHRDGPGEALSALGELCDGYGARPDHLEWYLATAILRRAPAPFRRFEDHWPERVDSMVVAAEAAAPA